MEPTAKITSSKIEKAITEINLLHEPQDKLIKIQSHEIAKYNDQIEKLKEKISISKKKISEINSTKNDIVNQVCSEQGLITGYVKKIMGENGEDVL